MVDSKMLVNTSNSLIVKGHSLCSLTNCDISNFVQAINVDDQFKLFLINYNIKNDSLIDNSQSLIISNLSFVQIKNSSFYKTKNESITSSNSKFIVFNCSFIEIGSNLIVSKEKAKTTIQNCSFDSNCTK
jgi:hypothetical protein